MTALEEKAPSTQQPSKHPPASTKRRRRCHWAIAVTVVLTVFSLSFESRELDRFKPNLSNTFSAKTRNATIAIPKIANENIPADNNTEQNAIFGTSATQTQTNSSIVDDRRRDGKPFDSINNNTNNTPSSEILAENDQADAEEQQPSLTLLVMLSGEFGNNMFKILRAWGVARLLERDFGWTTRLVFAQQRRRGKLMSKARDTAKKLQKCFLAPNYFKTQGIFGLGNKLRDEGYFFELDEIPGTNFTLSNDHQTIQDLQANLAILHDYLSNRPEFIQSTNTNSTVTKNGSIIPRLMVKVNSLVVYPIVNEFYEEIRKFFVFDETACCGETLKHPPQMDETVLHLRNYATEIRKKAARIHYGFEELAADRLASEVLGHLKPGDKVALTGRNLKSDSQKNTTQAYALVSALQQKNLTLRFSPGQTAMEDFCFLTHAQKELLGTPTSTYVQLAAYLAGPSLKSIRLYQYVPEQARNAHGDSWNTFRQSVGEHWTHPELASRIRFEQYLDETL